MICPTCNHRPSMRLNPIRNCESMAILVDCHCPCHDAADAGPELLTMCENVRDAIATAERQCSGGICIWHKLTPYVVTQLQIGLRDAIVLAKEPTP